MQTELDFAKVGRLPDGTHIQEGDIIRYEISMYTGITRVVSIDGFLCMEKNFMYGDGCSIAHFLKQASYNHITKMSLKEMYQYCKENKWNVAEYVVEYGQKK